MKTVGLKKTGLEVIASHAVLAPTAKLGTMNSAPFAKLKICNAYAVIGAEISLPEIEVFAFSRTDKSFWNFYAWFVSVDHYVLSLPGQKRAS